MERRIQEQHRSGNTLSKKKKTDKGMMSVDKSCSTDKINVQLTALNITDFYYFETSPCVTLRPPFRKARVRKNALHERIVP